MRDTDIKYIVIHCSATRATMDIGAKTIGHWHKERGWSRIGYHFVIRRDGSIELGRPLDMVGAHTKGHNRNSWGICLIGGVDTDNKPENNFTDAQFTSLRILIEGLKARAPEAEVLGHRDLSPDANGDGVIQKWEWLKACPCFYAREWYSGLPQPDAV